MMSIADIIELVILCALIFFPLGYLARHWLYRIRLIARIMFIKPRYVKPAGYCVGNRSSRQTENMTNQTLTPSRPSTLATLARFIRLEFLFLVKFGLLWAGYLNFHPLLNLVFMAFLLMPLPGQAAPPAPLDCHPDWLSPVLA
jgi:cellulose biosynthesis operon protein BcsF/YhjT